MEITNVQILTPKEGYYLTQATRMEDETPIMSKKVFNPQSADDWKEISEIKGDEMLAKFNAEQEKRMQAEMNNATR
jgi:hypothetical protein